MNDNVRCVACGKWGPLAGDQTDPSADEIAVDSRGLVDRNEHVCGECLERAEDALRTKTARSLPRDEMESTFPIGRDMHTGKWGWRRVNGCLNLGACAFATREEAEADRDEQNRRGDLSELSR